MSVRLDLATVHATNEPSSALFDHPAAGRISAEILEIHAPIIDSNTCTVSIAGQPDTCVMDFFHVVIDTSMLRQMHFQHPDFERLLLRSQKGLLKIYIPHIVKIVPEQSPAWSELAAALETTGVVVGEYGMAEAFELKRQDMLRWSTDEDANVRAFAAWLIEGLDKLIAWELQRADEGIELRKYRYGAGKDEAQRPTCGHEVFMSTVVSAGPDALIEALRAV